MEPAPAVPFVMSTAAVPAGRRGGGGTAVAAGHRAHWRAGLHLEYQGATMMSTRGLVHIRRSRPHWKGRAPAAWLRLAAAMCCAHVHRSCVLASDRTGFEQSGCHRVLTAPSCHAAGVSAAGGAAALPGSGQRVPAAPVARSRCALRRGGTAGVPGAAAARKPSQVPCSSLLTGPPHPVRSIFRCQRIAGGLADEVVSPTGGLRSCNV